MNPMELIHRYYADEPALEHILTVHSRQVAQRALQVAVSHPELQLDTTFLYEAAMLHDIGILRCDAPGIECHGTEPYIRHGVEGADILRREGLPRHARVAERHTGTGLTREMIVRQQLPLPPCDLVPETTEERVICYADKFYSKSRLEVEKTPEQVMRSLAKFGDECAALFMQWHQIFSI